MFLTSWGCIVILSYSSYWKVRIGLILWLLFTIFPQMVKTKVFFWLSLFLNIIVDSCISLIRCFNLLKSLIFLMCKSIILTTLCSLDQLLCIFWHGFVSIWFLDFRHSKMSFRLVCTFSAPDLESAIFQKALITFSGER